MVVRALQEAQYLMKWPKLFWFREHTSISTTAYKAFALIAVAAELLKILNKNKREKKDVILFSSRIPVQGCASYLGGFGEIELADSILGHFSKWRRIQGSYVNI